MATQFEYQIQRHPGETDRLNTQQKLLVKAVGYHLHPIIQRHLPTEPRVADLGAGTGAFLVDLSKQYPPTAQFDGYDVSDVAFIPPNERPANLTLNLGNCKEPPPHALHGTYDLVTMRFLNAALAKEDWASVASHAFRLLKPGGALQWIEGHFSQLLPIYQCHPDTVTSASEKGTIRAMQDFPHAGWFVPNLKPILESLGFREVKQHVMSSDRLPETRADMSRMMYGAYHGILRRMAASGRKDAWTLEEADEIYAEMLREIDAGAYVTCDFHQFFAFKPLQTNGVS